MTESQEQEEIRTENAVIIARALTSSSLLGGEYEDNLPVAYAALDALWDEGRGIIIYDKWDE